MTQSQIPVPISHRRDRFKTLELEHVTSTFSRLSTKPDEFAVPRRRAKSISFATPGHAKPLPAAFHSTGFLSKRHREKPAQTPETPLGPTRPAFLQTENMPSFGTNIGSATPFRSPTPANTNSQQPPSAYKLNRLHRSPLKESPTKINKRPHLLDSPSNLSRCDPISRTARQANDFFKSTNKPHISPWTPAPKFKTKLLNASPQDSNSDYSPTAASPLMLGGKSQKYGLQLPSKPQFTQPSLTTHSLSSKPQYTPKTPTQMELPKSSKKFDVTLPAKPLFTPHSFAVPKTPHFSTHLPQKPVFATPSEFKAPDDFGANASSNFFFSDDLDERPKAAVPPPISFASLISKSRVIIDREFFDALDGKEPQLSRVLSSLKKEISDDATSPIPDHFETRYELISRLGNGAFADAYHVISLHDSLHYAIKKTRQPFIGYKDAYVLITQP